MVSPEFPRRHPQPYLRLNDHVQPAVEDDLNVRDTGGAIRPLKPYGGLSQRPSAQSPEADLSQERLQVAWALAEGVAEGERERVLVAAQKAEG